MVTEPTTDFSSQNGQIRIEGEVIRITFRSDDGYTVFRLETSAETVTCVGYFARIGQGDYVRALGRWVSHPRYGRQFNVVSYDVVPPRTADGIVRYLSSGLIPGVGKAMAERIVRRFGERTLEIIDNEPNRLREIRGLGQKRVAAIKRAWREHRDVSELVVFLESHGIRAGNALRIYRQYGPRSIETVRANPYRLASEIWGIGFVTADSIASKLGIAHDAPVRIRAGVKYVLAQAMEEGHVFLPEELLRTRCVSMLGVDECAFESAISELAAGDEVICENAKVYLPMLLEAEKSVVQCMARLLEEESSLKSESFEQAIADIEIDLDMQLDESQVRAIKQVLRSKVAVITGGPGTGKTTIIRTLVGLFGARSLKVSLAAPTGRAAKRMSELAGIPAKTIHRLLEYNPQDGAFRRNSENPVVADAVIIDEASMLDLLLAAALLRAMKPSAILIFVGDVDQLPPVGPGSFLSDLIESRQVPVERLTRIFRQEEGGEIVENAHRINRGEFPLFSKTSGDFFFVEKERPEEVAATIVELCAERLPARFGLDRIDDIQVLSPMYKGDAGATNLNRMLQETANPAGQRLGDLRFRTGDKVMQLRNNYEKMVFNGDIGRVVGYDQDEGEITVRFDSDVAYDRSELDELTLAYAITVHKSQGSEFPCVVMPVLTQHYIMLHRNLLYTAVTRAKRLVILVGTKKAIALAVRSVRTDRRYSSLGDRLGNIGG